LTETVSKIVHSDTWTELCSGASQVLAVLQFDRRPDDDARTVLIRFGSDYPGDETVDGFRLDLMQSSIAATNLVAADKVWARAEQVEPVKLVVAYN
jgi:hypothetical protein